MALEPIDQSSPISSADWKLQAFEQILRPIIDGMLEEGISLKATEQLVKLMFVQRAQRIVQSQPDYSMVTDEVDKIIALTGATRHVVETTLKNAKGQTWGVGPMTPEGKVVAKWLEAIEKNACSFEVPIHGMTNKPMTFQYLVALAIRGAKHREFVRNLVDKGVGRDSDG